MSRAFALFAAGAALQIAIPAQPASPVIMVQLCSGGAPIPLPTKRFNKNGIDSEREMLGTNYTPGSGTTWREKPGKRRLRSILE